MSTPPSTSNSPTGFRLGVRVRIPKDASFWKLAPQKNMIGLLLLAHYNEVLLREKHLLLDSCSIVGDELNDGGFLVTVSDPVRAADLIVRELPPWILPQHIAIAIGYDDWREGVWRSQVGVSAVPLEQLFSVAEIDKALNATLAVQSALIKLPSRPRWYVWLRAVFMIFGQALKAASDAAEEAEKRAGRKKPDSTDSTDS